MAAKLTGPSIAKGMVKLSKAVSSASIDTLRAAGEEAAKAHEAVIKRDSGGDMALSGVGRRRGRPGNAKVGARFKVEKRGANPSGVVTATGPLHIINNTMRGHIVRSSYLYGSRGGVSRVGIEGPRMVTSSARRGRFIGPVQARRAVINIPGVGYRASAMHPGSKGKNTWRRGSRDAHPKIREQMSKRTTAVIRKAAPIP